MDTFKSEFFVLTGKLGKAQGKCLSISTSLSGREFVYPGYKGVKRLFILQLQKVCYFNRNNFKRNNLKQSKKTNQLVI